LQRGDDGDTVLVDAETAANVSVELEASAESRQKAVVHL
jgi:hypothetical protein